MIQVAKIMKTYKNLYQKLCSYSNLNLAFEKASKGKYNKFYVIEFELDLEYELKNLKHELESLTYKPKQLKKFIIRDPKTRTIRKSNFRDRVIHHSLINVLSPIYEKIFISDSYASRVNKGTLNAVKRFEFFMKQVSRNGKLICGGGRS